MSGSRSFNIAAKETRIGTFTSPTHENVHGTAGHFIVDIDTLSSGQTLTMEIMAVSASGSEYRLFRTLPMAVAGVYRYMLGPNVDCVPGIACRDFLPKHFKFVVVPSAPAQSDSYLIDVELNSV